MNILNYAFVLGLVLFIGGVIALRFNGRTKIERNAGTEASKFLLIIFAISFTALVLMMAGSSWGANYYGCGAGAINADTVWCTSGQVTAGVCAKDSGDYVAYSSIGAGDTLYANGCTITIPSGTFTHAKISTKGDGSKGAGGGFTATADGVTATLDASVEGGTTDCLTIGSGANVVVFNLLTTSGGGTITTDATATADGVSIAGSAATVSIGKSGAPVTVTGGSAANSAINDASTVTTKTAYANITAGSASTAYGYTSSGASGTVNLTGNSNGGTAGTTIGVNITSNATFNITGNCKGGAGAATTTGTATGCANSGGGTMTINGNCESAENSLSPGCSVSSTAIGVLNGNAIGNVAVPINGRFRFNPTAPAGGITGNYIRITYDGTNYYYYGLNTDDTTKALSTFFYIDPTDGNSRQGTATSGGGAWAF